MLRIEGVPGLKCGTERRCVPVLMCVTERRCISGLELVTERRCVPEPNCVTESRCVTGLKSVTERRCVSGLVFVTERRRVLDRDVLQREGVYWPKLSVYGRVFVNILVTEYLWYLMVRGEHSKYYIKTSRLAPISSR